MAWKIVGAIVFLFAFSIGVAWTVPSVVHVERSFPAPVSQVWKTWTDSESMKNWWSPKDYTAPVIESDFRVDGKFLYAMKSPSGTMHWNAGRYTVIEPEKKIVSLMSFSDENGKILTGSAIPVPGTWPDEIQVTAEFTSDAQKTTIKIKESGIPLLMSLFAKMGWEQQFDKLERLLGVPQS